MTRPLTPPRAEWGAAWDELWGYVKQAQEDGDALEPDDLLTYMSELRHRALAPVTAWMKDQR